MNFFGGLNGFGHGNGGTNNCVCTLVWLIFLLSICGCEAITVKQMNNKVATCCLFIWPNHSTIRTCV